MSQSSREQGDLQLVLELMTGWKWNKTARSLTAKVSKVETLNETMFRIPISSWVLIRYEKHDTDEDVQMVLLKVNQSDYSKLLQSLQEPYILIRDYPVTYDQMALVMNQFQELLLLTNPTFSDRGLVYYLDEDEKSLLEDLKRYPSCIINKLKIDDVLIISLAVIQLIWDYDTQIFPLCKPTNNMVILNKMFKYLEPLTLGENVDWHLNRETKNLDLNGWDIKSYIRKFVQLVVPVDLESFQINGPGSATLINIGEVYDKLWDEKTGDPLRRLASDRNLLIHIPVSNINDLIGEYITSLILEEFQDLKSLRQEDLISETLISLIHVAELRDLINMYTSGHLIDVL